MTKSTTRVAADLETFTQTEITAKDVVAKAGRKNLIINGGFDVWQRGVSNTNSTGHTADRWYGRCNLGTHEKVSRSGTTPNYIKVTKVGDDVDPFINTTLEDVASIYAGKTLTVSFEYKHLTGSTDVFQSGFGIYIYYSGGSGLSGDPSDPEALADGWVRYSYTFTLPANATGNLTIGNEFNPTNGVTFSLAITKIQLELGSVATDFEHRSYGEELALCQRYYYEITDAGTPGYSAILRATSGSGTQQYSQEIFFPVIMRGTPMVVITYIDMHKPGVLYDAINSVETVPRTHSVGFRFSVANSHTQSIACQVRDFFISLDAEFN
jgi:hypothetical protein